MQVSMIYILRILLVIAIVFLLAALGITILYGYQPTMLYLIDRIGESARQEQILALVSERKFLILQIVLLIAAAILVVVFINLNRITEVGYTAYVYIKEHIQALLTQLRNTEVKWILILPLISAVFFALWMPVSYDEAWTYLQFTSKSPLSSLCYYPAPNNHVLHSLITNVTRYIPFAPILFCLRISSILVSFFTWLLCYSFLRKRYSPNVALLITGIASMLFMAVYYSYMSRGYGLVTLFFVIGLQASYNIVFNGNNNKDWILFGVSSVLGFFTMPSYLYAFVLLNTLILFNNKFQLKKQIIYNLGVIILVVILYTPIIIVNGVSALTSNTFVLPISRREVIERLPSFFSDTLTEITGVHFMVTILLLAISFYMLMKSKMKFEQSMFIMFIVLPFVLLIGHSVIPFPRTFNYYGVILLLLICIPFKDAIAKVSTRYLLVALIVIQSLLFLNFYFNIKKYETFNITYHEINKKIVGNKSYFFTTVLFETNFLFENEIHGYKMTKAEFNFPQVNVDADTLSGFDYYIVDKQYDFTKNKKPAYSDGKTNVYCK
jgi:hypothetical protein